LGDKINSNINTVANRIKRLEKNGYIVGYNSHINYSKIGFNAGAVIKMVLKDANNMDRKSLEKIISMPGIEVLYGLSGSYHLCALLRAKDFDNLIEKIGEIRSMGIFKSVDSEFVVKKYMHFEDFNPLTDNPKQINPYKPRKKKLDSLDFAILRELRCGANNPLREFSAKLNYPISTIKERTDKMVESGIIKRFVANIDFYKLGYWNFQAMGIELNSESINDAEVPKQIAKIPNVCIMCRVLGEFDLYCAFLLKNQEDGVESIKRVSSIPGVKRVETHIGLAMYKSRMEYNPLSEFKMDGEKD
jgi:Lrp/AsnC family transcriptional regulator for asnA, asnC and gidA